MAKKTFFVREPLRHDGEDFAIGDKITLEAHQAAGLLAAGVIATDAVSEPSAPAEPETAGE